MLVCLSFLPVIARRCLLLSSWLIENGRCRPMRRNRQALQQQGLPCSVSPPPPLLSRGQPSSPPILAHATTSFSPCGRVYVLRDWSSSRGGGAWRRAPCGMVASAPVGLPSACFYNPCPLSPVPVPHHAHKPQSNGQEGDHPAPCPHIPVPFLPFCLDGAALPYLQPTHPSHPLLESTLTNTHAHPPSTRHDAPHNTQHTHSFPTNHHEAHWLHRPHGWHRPPLCHGKSRHAPLNVHACTPNSP